MSFPIQYISSSVVNVNIFYTSKIIMLPPASTIQGIPLYIRDWSGLAATNPIYVSTQLNDLMDNYASTIVLDRAYQSFRVVPYSTTRYAITANYTEGLMPYEYAIQLLLEFFEVSLAENWTAVAVSPNGEVMLAVASGGSTDGFYVSIDTGASFSRYESRAGSFVSCAVGTRYMYVLDSSGALYRSEDNGLNWTPLQLPEGNTYISMSINTDGDYLVIITQTLVYWSSDLGTTFNDASFPIGENVEFTNCALGDAPSISQDDLVVYITAQDQFGPGDYIYVCTNLTEGGFFSQQGPLANWTTVSCNQSGSIAYALTTNGELYKSTDYGGTWTYIDLLITLEPFYNTQIKCSSDGQTLYGIDGSSQRYLTKDGAASFTAVGDMLAGMLNSYGLSANGLMSLFAVPNVGLNVGRTRIQ